MPTATITVLDTVTRAEGDGWDGLRLGRPPFVPEVQLHLADDAILLRARLEAQTGRSLPPPFWADAWIGGQAVARHILDHPHLVAGRHVLDIASGSGLVAIAAALAGASSVTANDIDPFSLAAIELNARANDVAVAVVEGDLLDGDGGTADVVLAGDVFYDSEMADRMLGFIERVTARGALVLVGDPGRDHLPSHRLHVVAGYSVTTAGAPQDAQFTRVEVLQPTRG